MAGHRKADGILAARCETNAAQGKAVMFFFRCSIIIQGVVQALVHCMARQYGI